uniref:Uncharacterized protein n=1 Tax=Cyanothece sp. (strain PCC 7425 / ATCC 29141) TaxID=395961 RepID=B8HZH3_CYAP4
MALYGTPSQAEFRSGDGAALSGLLLAVYRPNEMAILISLLD